MSNICLTLLAHQPNRLIAYDFFKIGEHAFYEDDDLNARVLSAVAERCYFPANRLMKQLVELTNYKFKFALGLSGVILEQALYHRPDLIASFKDLADTGCVEFLLMPYYNSLAAVYSPQEFVAQIEEHKVLIKKLFNLESKVLVNSSMLYSNAIAGQAEDMGLEGIIADGNAHELVDYHVNDVYLAPFNRNCTTIFRNSELSNILAVNRVDSGWSEYPLSPYVFTDWLTNQPGNVVPIVLDYETLGERQDDASGVFEFWSAWITSCVDKGNRFITPTELVREIKPLAVCECVNYTTCTEQGTMSLWTTNVMQREAISKVYKMEKDVKAAKDDDLTHVWRKLQSADHFHYMDKENSFTPYASAFDAYIYYMNALSDLQVRLKRMKSGEL